MHEPYVIIAPSYMVYAQNYSELLQAHIDSEADITLLYHSVDNAREAFINCDVLNLNKQKGVESIEKTPVKISAAPMSATSAAPRFPDAHTHHPIRAAAR